MKIDPNKLGISTVVAIVLLSGGIIALTSDEPSITIRQSQPSKVANQQTELPAVTQTEEIVSTDNSNDNVEPIEQSAAIDDTMDVEVIQASMEAFDPITSGDWSLENISDYALEIVP